MRHWWVNQNQTFRQEIEGGYLWSPKRNKNGHRNPFYEFMREVSPGDIVFSFCDTRIAALGIVSGYGRESRLNVRSTVLCSQLPVDKWHAYLGEPTLANAILDRLVHHSHRIELKTGGGRLAAKVIGVAESTASARGSAGNEAKEMMVGVGGGESDHVIAGIRQLSISS